MNIYLLRLVGKWISLLFVSITSLVGSEVFNERKIAIKNSNAGKSNTPIVELIKYETIIKYNQSLPTGTKKTVVKGIDGIVSKDQEKLIQEVVNEVIEIGIGKEGNYTGRLTGYGPDCYGCSGVGVVSCRTPDRKRYSLVKDGIIYNDKEYGELRILSATHEIFPCGTIVSVKKGNEEPFLGVVMDTGIAMRNAWKENKQILFDLAFSTEKDPDIYKATARNVKYEVKRWGW